MEVEKNSFMEEKLLRQAYDLNVLWVWQLDYHTWYLPYILINNSYVELNILVYLENILCKCELFLDMLWNKVTNIWTFNSVSNAQIL